MAQEQWSQVDDYFSDLLIPSDAVLNETLHRAEQAGLPAMQVAPNQGKLLHILAKSIRAEHILEVGTLAGYSTIWLARALPAYGKLVTLEVNPHHAKIARANFEAAQLSAKIELRVGQAMDSLAQLFAEGYPPFDFVFIDADKINNSAYFEWALRLTRAGGLIIVDNVVRNGAVLEADSMDTNVQGVRHLNERLASEPRVIATAIQTVGSKGYDGFAIMVVV